MILGVPSTASSSLLAGMSDVVSLDLRSTLNRLRQHLLHLNVALPIVCLGALFVIPQTVRDRFGSVRFHQDQFILESLLLAKYRHDFIFDCPSEVLCRIGLQSHGND